MAAFDDLIEGASSARFLSLIVGTIFTRQIEIKKDGYIRSENFNFDTAASGFKFSAKDGLLEAIAAKLKGLTATGGTFKNISVTGNSVFGAVDGNGNLVGNIEFFGKITAKNNSTFEGKIKAGEIEATAINVNGTVASGTAFVLKSDNNMIRAYSETVPLKEILTYAKGSCKVRAMFPTLPSTQGTNGGKYKITVASINNGEETVIKNWTDYSGNDVASIDVTLIYNPTKVRLYMDTRASDGQVSFIQINTTFELRCKDDPGILGALPRSSIYKT